jgi:hypothetical protein
MYRFLAIPTIFDFEKNFCYNNYRKIRENLGEHPQVFRPEGCAGLYAKRRKAYLAFLRNSRLNAL